MTHPLVEALAASIGDEEEARLALLALLRHPAMREPSAAIQEWRNGDSSQVVFVLGEWRAGLDALAREVEEDIGPHDRPDGEE